MKITDEIVRALQKAINNKGSVDAAAKRVRVRDNDSGREFEDSYDALMIAVGCTGGRHRSTAVAHHLATFIGEQGFPVSESHRDISR